MPTLFAVGQVQMPGPVSNGYWETVTAFHRRFPALSDAGASGYYSILPNNMVNGTAMPLISFQLFFVSKTDVAPAKKILDAFMVEASKYTQSANYTVDKAPSVIQAINMGLAPTESDGGGGIVTIASRLFSRDLLSCQDGPGRLSNALKDIYNDDHSTSWTGHLVAGGAVASNRDIDSALNPAWRRTITHITFGRSWPNNATLAEQRAIQHKLTYVDNEKLRMLEPDMGAYLNEADAHEAGFQQSFWGENYDRLYKIKQNLDPQGLFIVRRGVGSEDWDEDGICKVKRSCGGHDTQARL